jgi:hypothetical protein
MGPHRSERSVMTTRRKQQRREVATRRAQERGEDREDE